MGPNGLVILTLLFVIGGIASWGLLRQAEDRGDRTTTTTRAASTMESPSQPPEDPNLVCANQLVAITTHFVNELHAGAADPQLTERLVNGPEDLHFVQAGFLYDKYLQWSMQHRREGALSQAMFEARRICSDMLGNTIRPNYPTDGTYSQ